MGGSWGRNGNNNIFMNVQRRASRTTVAQLFLNLLMNNTNFRNKFVNIFCDYANQVFNISRVGKILEKYRDFYGELVPHSQLRWQGGRNNIRSVLEGIANYKSNYLKRIDSLYNFYESRPIVALQNMKDFSGFVEYIKNHDNFKGTITQDELLAPKSTFKIGGRASVYVAPEDYYSFQLCLRRIIADNLPFYITGGGSNLVFPDDGFKGVILSSQNFNDVMLFPKGDLPEDFPPEEAQKLGKDDLLVTCFAGTPMAAFVSFCTKNDLSGAEQFAGLPGTVGGAAYMIARCFDKSISDIIYYYTWMDYSDKDIPLHHERINPADWDYKKSPFQNNNTASGCFTFSDAYSSASVGVLTFLPPFSTFTTCSSFLVAVFLSEPASCLF
jgi:hypothetical protein